MTVVQLIGHDASNVSEANWESVFGGMFEGVFSGVDNECEVIASAPAAMTVEARTGTLVSGGVFGRITAQDVLTIAASDPVNDRIDRIVARRTNATNTFELAVLTGTPAGSPVPDALTRAGGVYEISLAQVLVQATVVQINTADITDERSDYSVCGYALGSGSIQTPEILPIRKAAAETVNNSAVLQDDDDFTFPIGPNEIWLVEMDIYISANVDAGADLQCTWTLPAGASMLLMGQATDDSVGTVHDHAVGTTPGTGIVFVLPAGAAILRLTATLRNGATPGTAAFQWAQNAAKVDDLTFAIDSSMIAHRMA